MSYDMTKLDLKKWKELKKVTDYNRKKILFHPLYNKKKFVKDIYKAQTTKELDYNNLKTFNEKLNGFKINKKYMKRVHPYADKELVRSYIKEKIGSKHLIKEYFCKNKITKEDLEELPNSFVLKTTLGSGTNLIVKDKSKFDLEEVCNYMNYLTTIHYGYIWGEFLYEYGKSRIIAEELLTDDKGNIPDDFKCFCFQDNDGNKKKVLYVERVIGNERARILFDENWNQIQLESNFELLDEKIPRPKNLKKILSIIDKLSEDFNFVRVDLFLLNNKIYFGELTFIPTAGYLQFKNEEDNLRWGSYIGDNKL